jgi:hypothetical protein
MKKTFVLVTLFVLPIVVYLFFASGVYNFGKLPILTENVVELPFENNAISLKDKITILGFLGSDINTKKANAFNLNQKIYKRFYEFSDLQFVMVVSEDTQPQVAALKKELGVITDIQKWQFVYLPTKEINNFFEGLKTNLTLDATLATPYVFIIDKDRNLRGRDDDEDVGTKYGFDATSVADLNNKMVDDVKIILAEYRLALKKNSANREK